MENKMEFSRWLSKKLCLASVGFYATIGAIMVLSAFFTNTLGLHKVIASFVTFFSVILARTIYESLVIYEAPVKSL
jgi:hypothetical protein